MRGTDGIRGVTAGLLLIFLVSNGRAAIQATPPGYLDFGACGMNRQQGYVGRLLVAVDPAGNLFFTEQNSTVIRKMTPDGVISKVAGDGKQGYGPDSPVATSVSLGSVGDLAADAAGNLFIVDVNLPRVRKLTPSGAITTIAGNGLTGFSGDGGPAITASLCPPTGIAVDGKGNVFIASGPGSGEDSFLPGDYRVRKIDPAGIITTVAGTGAPPGRTLRSPNPPPDGSPATASAIWAPNIAADAAGNLYIRTNAFVLKVAPDGALTRVAGRLGQAQRNPGGAGDGGSAVSAPIDYLGGDLSVDPAGNIFFLEWQDGRLRKVDANGIITTIAGGKGRALGGDGIPAASVAVNPVADNTGSRIAFGNSGNLYFVEVEDGLNSRIRRIAPNGTISTVYRSSAGRTFDGPFKVSGKVISGLPVSALAKRTWTGAIEPVQPDVQIYLVAKESDGIPAQLMSTPASTSLNAPANGEFKMANVPPGSYELFAQLPDIEGLDRHSWGRASLEVRADRADVIVSIERGVDVTGRVTVDGRPGTLDGLKLSLQADAPASTTVPFIYQLLTQYQPQVSADGSFSIRAVPAAQYRVHAVITGQPNASIADILINGKSVKDTGVAIGSAKPGVIEIAIRTR
jgi:hypothetical protein